MTDAAMDPLHIMLVAAEPSGDRLGGQLMAALKSTAKRPLKFSGVGGPRMTDKGIDSLFSIDDMAVMGLAQVAPMVFKALARVDKTVAFAMEHQPHAVVLIDSSGFTDRIGARLKKKGYSGAIIKYVAPQVWASRPYRTRQIAKFLDHVLTLYPFEPGHFTKEGLAASFVGHPLTEERIEQIEDSEFIRTHGIDPQATTLCVLPGSRSNETHFLLPVFRETIELLATSFPDLQLVLPLSPNVADRVRAEVRTWPLPAICVEGEADKHAAFRISRVALAASGTVTLELARAGLPMVVAYKVGWLTSTIFRPFVISKHICIVNILAGARIVPEFIQEECHPQLISNALRLLLQNEMARSVQIQNITQAFATLKDTEGQPGLRAAEAVLSTIEQKQKEVGTLLLAPA